jgi:2-polyprenyl-6-methoxyphenol hydroxylase-like FAD-dependent oxidoreductase
MSDAYGDLSAIGYLDDGVEVGTARATRDAIYWYMSLLSRDIESRDRTSQAVMQRFSDSGRRDSARNPPGNPTRGCSLRRPVHERSASQVGQWASDVLGDAAHPMLPHTGQGAAQALEDAVALGLALPPQARSTQDFDGTKPSGGVGRASSCGWDRGSPE